MNKQLFITKRKKIMKIIHVQRYLLNVRFAINIRAKFFLNFQKTNKVYPKQMNSLFTKKSVKFDRIT